MLIDLLKQFVPWIFVVAIIILLWFIFINKKRIRKIRHTGRVSEIIDRRRNIAFFFIVIALLIIGLFVDLFA